MAMLPAEEVLSEILKDKKSIREKEPEEKKEERPKPLIIHYPEFDCPYTDAELTKMWESFDVNEALESLYEAQRYLAIHANRREYEEVEYLQGLLIQNTKNKILAVRHVTENAHTPGIDHVMWRTPAQKMKAALSLVKKDYKANPLKTYILTGRNGKERLIGIPTLRDRAMQTLYDFALAPVTDTWGDKTSYAFRPGKSMQDAIYAVKAMFNGSEMPSIAIKTDVTAFYASIQQAWLLEHAPMDKEILSEFLNCGQIFPGELFPRYEDGISLGCPLSPRLGNFILDGLQDYIRNYLAEHKGKSRDYPNGAIVRYADDVIASARTMEDAEFILQAIREFFKDRGLSMSEKKTEILDLTEDSFTFLSCVFKKRDGAVRMEPCPEAVDACKAGIQEYLSTGSHSQRMLIIALNKKLTGWSSYFRYTDAKDAFREIDSAVDSMLLQYLSQKYPRLSEEKLRERFWYEETEGHFVFALPDDKTIRLNELKDVLLMTHDLPPYRIKYYINRGYFEKRENKGAPRYITGKYKSVLNRQNLCCAICKRPILPDQSYEVIKKDDTKRDMITNTEYVHSLCSRSSVVRHFIKEDPATLTQAEAIGVIKSINRRNPAEGLPSLRDEMPKVSRHYPLKKYLAQQNAASLILTFEEIEKIEKKTLPPTAYKYAGYWYRSNAQVSIAEAWNTEGYHMEKLNLKKKVVKLKRIVPDRDHLKLPRWLSEDTVLPSDARNEIEKFISYIGAKYSL